MGVDGEAVGGLSGMKNSGVRCTAKVGVDTRLRKFPIRSQALDTIPKKTPPPTVLPFVPFSTSLANGSSLGGGLS